MPERFGRIELEIVSSVSINLIEHAIDFKSFMKYVLHDTYDILVNILFRQTFTIRTNKYATPSRRFQKQSSFPIILSPFSNCFQQLCEHRVTQPLLQYNI